MQELKVQISGLEEELQRTKQRYADTLRNLDRLNHSLHQQRCANSLSPCPQASSDVAANSDCESVQSWQVVEGVQFTGSTGSLPSIGSSVAEETEDQPHTPPSEPHRPSPAPIICVTGAEDKVAQFARELVQHTLHSALTRLAQHSP